MWFLPLIDEGAIERARKQEEHEIAMKRLAEERDERRHRELVEAIRSLKK